MQSVDYPLQAVLRLREEIQRQHEQQLAAAIAEEEAASVTFAAAERDVGEASQRLRLQREAQAQRRGRARMADLQRSSAYGHHLKLELSEVEEHRDRLLARHRACQEATRLARQGLAEALKRAEVIRCDFERWTRERREEAQRRAEQELEDLAMARRGAQLGRS